MQTHGQNFPGSLSEAVRRLRSAAAHFWRAKVRVAQAPSAEGRFQMGVVRKGQLELEVPLDLPDETRVQVIVEPAASRMGLLRPALKVWLWASSDLLRATGRLFSLEFVIFIAALGVYALTRFWALERFPVYFFSDEAAQALFGEQLIRSGFKDAQGIFLPMYVEAAGFRWTPLLPMYLHALTLTLFGKSILVTRATSAAVSLLGAASVGLMLKKVFQLRSWWAGILLVAVTPTWMLHSRTAFETVMTTAFYGCFLLFYLLYRNKDPRYLYPAILFGAATFYTYSNGQVIMAAAAALLLISDLRYHLKQWRTLAFGALLAALLAWPLINFRLHQPLAIGNHLRAIDTYWFHDIPLQEKIGLFLQKYTYALSPQYWFYPNEQDLARHHMAGLGNILAPVLPLFIIGLLISLWKFRSSPYRAILLAGLAVPAGTALVDIGITRVLAFIIPANLLAALGLDWLLERLKGRIPYPFMAVVLFAGLSWGSFALLHNALANGPLWFKDYGLYGMQYGARQLFEEAIPQILKQEPQTQVLVSSAWANGADEFLRFFFTEPEQQRVRMEGVEAYLFRQLPLDSNMLFVMTPAEYDLARASPKLKSVTVERVLPYPDGTPGFTFARLAYVGHVASIFAEEREARRALVTAEMELWGQNVQLRYSQVDMGGPQYMFDGDHFTLMRGLEANPFILEMTFSDPRPVTGLAADFGLFDMFLTVELYADPNGEPVVYQLRHPNDSKDPNFSMTFAGAPQKVSKVRFEIQNFTAGDSANIHIMELKLLP